ncbi:MAG: hypothetical protein KKH32_07940, partial [Bacteroidetes bacterium]|nr:hypothetical protein [Bacteroidota bacterium]
MMKRHRKLTLFAILIACTILISEHLSEPTEEDKNLPGSFEALNWFTEQRAFPNDDIPGDKYFKEFLRYKSSLKKYPFNNVTDIWQNIGPKNVGGRTLSIAINPIDTNIVWLGSASGGLWKSVTGGTGSNAWHQVPLGFPVLGVSSVVIDPLYPSVMYVGTGETYNYQNAIMGVSIRTTRGSYG